MFERFPSGKQIGSRRREGRKRRGREREARRRAIQNTGRGSISVLRSAGGCIYAARLPQIERGPCFSHTAAVSIGY